MLYYNKSRANQRDSVIAVFSKYLRSILYNGELSTIVTKYVGIGKGFYLHLNFLVLLLVQL